MTLLSRAFQAMIPKATRPPMGGMSSLMGFGDTAQGGQMAQMRAYGGVGWLFAVVERISTSVASAEWDFYRVSVKGERREEPQHHWAQLWKWPNPHYTQEEFVSTSQQHLELVGEAWWILLRNSLGLIEEIWPIRPDKMRPVPDRQEYIKGYVYTHGAEQIPLDSDCVIFLRSPNPLNPYRGMGRVQALLSDIESEGAAARWTRNFFRNNALPGGIIETDDNISDEDYDKFVQRWRISHQGVENAHRVAILESGMTWKDRKFTMRDMQLEQLRKVTRDTILGAFGMPLAIMGITESVNRANAEAAEVLFARWVLRSRLRRIKSALNERLIPEAVRGTLEFDFKPVVPVDRELEMKIGVEGFKNFILTRNESRELLGFPGDEEGGDEYMPPPAPGGIPKALGLALKVAPRESTENRMRRSWAERLEKEGNALAAYIGEAGKSVKRLEVGDMAGFDWDWWAKYGDEVIEELTIAFVEAMPMIEPVTVQRLAAQYAETRGARLLRLDGDLNIAAATRERVNELVATALDEGKALGSIQKAIREDFVFSPQRAENIARTETATALGQGQKQVALIEGREEKRWYTQGDELVSPECSANEGDGWIPIGDNFSSGVDTIPQHPRCRCNTRYRHKPVAAGYRVVEGRCPECNKLLAKSVPVGTKLWCSRCKQEVPIEGEPEALPGRVIKQTVVRDESGRIVEVLREERNG